MESEIAGRTRAVRDLRRRDTKPQPQGPRRAHCVTIAIRLSGGSRRVEQVVDGFPMWMWPDMPELQARDAVLANHTRNPSRAWHMRFPQLPSFGVSSELFFAVTHSVCKWNGSAEG